MLGGCTMNFDYLFILTYGRSGSTLLQGVLNSIPGVLIRGENNSTLRALTRAWKSLSIADSGFSGDKESPKHAWFGMDNWDRENYGHDLASAFVKNVLCPQPNTKVIGFKEIRYFPPHFEPEIEIDFIRKFFRKSAIIINTRDLDNTFQSIKRAGHSITREQLERSDNMLRSLANLNDANDIYHVHYDDYQNNAVALKPLFEFIGAEFDLHSIKNVLSDRHSIQSK